jgi:hypothetical protein
MPDEESGVFSCDECEKDWTWDLADKDGNMTFVKCDEAGEDDESCSGLHLCDTDCWRAHVINNHGIDYSFKNINIKTGVISGIKDIFADKKEFINKEK